MNIDARIIIDGQASDAPTIHIQEFQLRNSSVCFGLDDGPRLEVSSTRRGSDWRGAAQAVETLTLSFFDFYGVLKMYLENVNAKKKHVGSTVFN